MAQRFDTRDLQLVGEPVPIAEQVAIRPLFSRGVFSASENGKLVYGISRQPVTQLIWRDREGKQLGTVAKPGRYPAGRSFPDEKTVAAEIIDRHVQTPDIWLIETARGSASRFTSGCGRRTHAPGGRQMVAVSSFHPRVKVTLQVFSKKRQAAAAERSCYSDPDLVIQPTDWSRDGRFIVYARQDPRHSGTCGLCRQRRPGRGRAKASALPSDAVQRASRSFFRGWKMDGLLIGQIKGKMGSTVVAGISIGRARDGKSRGMAAWSRDGGAMGRNSSTCLLTERS